MMYDHTGPCFAGELGLRHVKSCWLPPPLQPIRPAPPTHNCVLVDVGVDCPREQGGVLYDGDVVVWDYLRQPLLPQHMQACLHSQKMHFSVVLQRAATTRGLL
jgi:hypothetical protein